MYSNEEIQRSLYKKNAKWQTADVKNGKIVKVVVVAWVHGISNVLAVLKTAEVQASVGSNPTLSVLKTLCSKAMWSFMDYVAFFPHQKD
jgi:hypothetical protein